MSGQITIAQSLGGVFEAAAATPTVVVVVVVPVESARVMLGSVLRLLTFPLLFFNIVACNYRSVSKWKQVNAS